MNDYYMLRNCTSLFTVVLFRRAQTWKRPKMNGAQRKTYCTHAQEYSSALQGRKSCHFKYMDETWGHYAKGKKSDRERQIVQNVNYMWNLKHPIQWEKKDRPGGYQGQGMGVRWGNWVEVGRRYRVPATCWLQVRNVMYNMMTRINTAVYLYVKVAKG